MKCRGTFVKGSFTQLAGEFIRCVLNLLAIQKTTQRGVFATEIKANIFLNRGGKTRILGLGFMILKLFRIEWVIDNLV